MTKRLQLLSACLGNLFEHYDTALFSYLSPFFGPVNLPQRRSDHRANLNLCHYPTGHDS